MSATFAFEVFQDGQGQRPAFNWSRWFQLQALLLLLSWWQAYLQPEACQRGQKYPWVGRLPGEYGKIWQDMARYGKIWQDMARYGKIWQRKFMEIMWHVSPRESNKDYMSHCHIAPFCGSRREERQTSMLFESIIKICYFLLYRIIASLFTAMRYVSICCRPASESLCTPLVSASSMTFAVVNVVKQRNAAEWIWLSHNPTCHTHSLLLLLFHALARTQSFTRRVGIWSRLGEYTCAMRALLVLLALWAGIHINIRQNNEWINQDIYIYILIIFPIEKSTSTIFHHTWFISYHVACVAYLRYEMTSGPYSSSVCQVCYNSTRYVELWGSDAWWR